MTKTSQRYFYAIKAEGMTMDMRIRSALDAVAPQGTASNVVQRVIDSMRKKVAPIHPKLLLARLLLTPLPQTSFPHIRAQVLRAIGFQIGPRSGFYSIPTFWGCGNIFQRLVIGHDCWFNMGCNIELNASITIGNGVCLGPEVMLLTGTHDVGPEDFRTGPFITLPVTIDDGAWIGARCTILPGITIGKGAVISAGTVVRRNVPPNRILIGDKVMRVEDWRRMMDMMSSTHVVCHQNISSSQVHPDCSAAFEGLAKEVGASSSR